MPGSYARLCGLAVFVFAPVLSRGQSLEDKAFQARKLQALSMGLEGVNPDSLEKAGESDQKPGLKSASVLDSMIAGPKASDIHPSREASPSAPETARAGESGKGPKRYEQRIFQSLDRSAFTSAMGAVGREYVLGPGDAVTLSLWGDRDTEYSLVLNSDGSVFVEGVGLVPIGGLSVEQGEKRVKDRLARIYSGIQRGTTFVNLAAGRPGPRKVFLLGEVRVPGGYVFTGHTSVLAALYYAQGPTDIGTVRNLVLNRAGKKIPLDVYDYLIRGETLKPDVLQDGDILFAGRAERLVEIEGDVGRPAVYEMKKGEGIKELLQCAGGLNATAAVQKMTLQRVFENGKVDYLDLPPPQEFLRDKMKFELRDGDRILVEKSSEPSEAFYTISGPVKYPGTYQAEGVASVKDLIEKAGGLREDAFLGRVHVIRFHPDGSSDIFAHNTSEQQGAESIALKPKDNVILYSRREMFLPDSVEIAGAVFKPGRYEFRQGMTVKDLVMQAGGFLPEHESGKALVFRGGALERKVEQMDVSMQPGLDMGAERIELQPFDIVHIPVDPRWYRKEVVALEGLVKYPGRYALLHPGEKLASVIARAGGFKDEAYVEGARFFRAKDNVGRVGVDVERAARRPKSKANISLVHGDNLYIPERSNTVKVIGEIGFETSVLYKEGASTRYYIEKAGGFTRRSEKNRVVVQYANGESSSEGMFNRDPDAGSVIYVPRGPEPKAVDWIGGINALVGTAGVVVALILSIQAISK